MLGKDFKRIQLALLLSLMTSGIVTVIVILLYLSSLIENPIIAVGLIFLLVLIISFIILSQFLERYVLRRIRLIYKIINSTKLGGNPNLTDSDFYKSSSLEEVNTEVVSWAKNTAQEIKALKSLEEYRKQYVGDISHELKTPIFSLQGYLHTLLEGGMYDEKILKRYIEKASANADRLEMIVKDLEYINVLEGQETTLEFSSFPLKPLIDEVLSDLTLTANEKNISFGFKAGDDEDFIAKADKDTIIQVLTNLIVNSIKYGKVGGTTRIGLYDMDENILIEISDDGIGIEDHHHKHLFDRFYRVERSRNREDGGSGLGLSIVKHIIEAHGQTISVRSTKDVGSTFGFTLAKHH